MLAAFISGLYGSVRPYWNALIPLLRATTLDVWVVRYGLVTIRTAYRITKHIEIYNYILYYVFAKNRYLNKYRLTCGDLKTSTLYKEKRYSLIILLIYKYIDLNNAIIRM